MGEWWTYRVSHFVMFAPRTYFRLFELYNGDLWPAHAAALALGLAMAVLLLRASPRGGTVLPALLALAWPWVAWAYLHERYATIHYLGNHLALAFAAQGLLLAGWSLARRWQVQPPSAWPACLGGALFAFALLAYPFMAPLHGRGWAQAEVFAMAPDPTAVATLGLVTASARPAWVLLPIPVLWCGFSSATLASMGAVEALVPLSAALLALAVAAWKAAMRSP
jgi:hypothetical protein